MSVLAIWDRFMRKPITTDWVSVADINGTGTTEVSSTDMSVYIDGIRDIATPPLLQVQYDHQVTGGTGNVETWARLRTAHSGANTGPAPLSDLYTMVKRNDATSRSRDFWFIPGNVFMPRGSSVENLISITLYSRGTVADGSNDTVWEVKNIRARFIYTPL